MLSINFSLLQDLKVLFIVLFHCRGGGGLLALSGNPLKALLIFFHVPHRRLSIGGQQCLKFSFSRNEILFVVRLERSNEKSSLGKNGLDLKTKSKIHLRLNLGPFSNPKPKTKPKLHLRLSKPWALFPTLCAVGEKCRLC